MELNDSLLFSLATGPYCDKLNVQVVPVIKYHHMNT